MKHMASFEVSAPGCLKSVDDPKPRCCASLHFVTSAVTVYSSDRPGPTLDLSFLEMGDPKKWSVAVGGDFGLDAAVLTDLALGSFVRAARILTFRSGAMRHWACPRTPWFSLKTYNHH